MRTSAKVELFRYAEAQAAVLVDVMIRMPRNPAADLVDGRQTNRMILRKPHLNLVPIDLASLVDEPKRPGDHDTSIVDSNVERRMRVAQICAQPFKRARSIAGAA